MNDNQVIQKLKELVSEGYELEEKLHVSLSHVSVEGYNKPYYHISERWKGKCLNLLKLRFGAKSDYFLDFFREINTSINHAGDYSKDNVGKSLGILEAVLYNLENGLTEDLFYQREILIFSDLLEQAYEFLGKGLREASAIYGRIVLEITIKEFASKNNINEKSFDQTIIKLRQAGIIHQPMENSLRANYQIGSDATHNNADFKKYSDSEIKDFLNFIRDKVLTLK